MEQKHQPYYHCNRTTGNTTIHDLFEEGCSRQMCWDEENRLAGFSDCHNAGFYQYDANGKRTYKLTWAGSSSNRSGDRSIYYTPDEATLYASPYLVVTPQGYTKHYYAEAERITSQLGKGQFADVGTPVVSDSLVQVKLQAVTNGVDHPATLTVPASSRFSYLDTLTNQQNATSTLYFYHPDHLGSSSWITTTNGTVKQHLHYLPWGEDFINQRASGYIGARYTFSAKEKDSETSLSYFGARYYSSDLSIWLSVDPMSAKYPSLSSYVYCADNSIKLIDPNGESPIKPIKTIINIIKKAYGIYKKTGRLTPKALKNAGLEEIIDIAGDLYTIFDSESSYLDIIKASVDLFVGTELNKKGGKAVVESASNIANKVKREASAKLRKKWENANNKPWPKILLIPVEIKMLATKSHYPMVEQTMLATLNQTSCRPCSRA